MNRERLNDGSLLIDYFRNLKQSFWSGTGWTGFTEFYEELKKKDNGVNITYYWIQFPKPHTLATPNEFLDAIQGLERYSWFNKYIFNIEFNPHIHCHLIVTSPGNNIRPTRIIDNISKHLALKKNHIECKRYSHSYENRLNYVKGLKIPIEKQRLVDKDKEDREKYNINTYYSDALPEEAQST